MFSNNNNVTEDTACKPVRQAIFSNILAILHLGFFPLCDQVFSSALVVTTVSVSGLLSFARPTMWTSYWTYWTVLCLM